MLRRHRRKAPFYYEAEVSPDYTEHGVESGARLDCETIDNPDVKLIYETTKQMNLPDSLAWIESHKDEFSPSTVVINTDDGDSLRQYGARKPKFFVSELHLNFVRHLNTLLNRANETLEEGGYFWGFATTAVLKRKLILEHYPKVINHIVYFFHYLWHRFMAKLPLTRKLYFAVTGGKNRTYNRVEVLGRMYRAGFEVVDEEFRFGQFFVLARKVKEPIWNDIPTGSPIIRLERIGKGGKLIRVYKFRTMYSYSEYLQPYIYEHNKLDKGGKFADDYRVNSWGRLFRKLWIDEYPMFFNILKGDMKLVGVRPLSNHYFSLYTPEMQELRIKVKPGLLPPFYYDKKTPTTLEEVQESERRYIEAYLEHPFRTDWRYFWGTFSNIVFRGKRSK